MFSESRSVTPTDNKDSVNLYQEIMAEVALGTPMVFEDIDLGRKRSKKR